MKSSQKRMQLDNVKKQSSSLIDRFIGKCPLCLKGLTNAVLIATHDYTSEGREGKDASLVVKDLREERIRYHTKCMEESIKKYPDYMKLIRDARSHYAREMYHIRYLYDASNDFSSGRKE